VPQTASGEVCWASRSPCSAFLPTPLYVLVSLLPLGLGRVSKAGQSFSALEAVGPVSGQQVHGGLQPAADGTAVSFKIQALLLFCVLLGGSECGAVVLSLIGGDWPDLWARLIFRAVILALVVGLVGLGAGPPSAIGGAPVKTRGTPARWVMSAAPRATVALLKHLKPPAPCDVFGLLVPPLPTSIKRCSARKAYKGSHHR